MFLHKVLACIKECKVHPCCRYMNYERASSVNHSDKCEFLHYLLENTSYVLEINSSFEHLLLEEPLKLIGETRFNFLNSRSIIEYIVNTRLY